MAVFLTIAIAKIISRFDGYVREVKVVLDLPLLLAEIVMVRYTLQPLLLEAYALEVVTAQLLLDDENQEQDPLHCEA